MSRYSVCSKTNNKKALEVEIGKGSKKRVRTNVESVTTKHQSSVTCRSTIESNIPTSSINAQNVTILTPFPPRLKLTTNKFT